jgi:MFS transporter, YNFM family, putative membrane transport protein
MRRRLSRQPAPRPTAFSLASLEHSRAARRFGARPDLSCLSLTAGGKAAAVTSTSPLPSLAASAAEPPLIARGGARFWRVSFALFFGSFATFAVLYCVQPLMPGFASAFSISPAAASLSLSATTGVLAVAMAFAGTVSDLLGRKAVMTASLAAASVATLAAAFSPNWTTLIVLRALTGLALSGVPAVAMAYLAEEMDRSAIGLAMGLYIAGNTLGGMAGRLGSAGIADAGCWRTAFAIVGVMSLGSAVLFAFALPRERRLPPKSRPAALLPAIRMHFSDPGLRYLFALGFLLMGIMVTTYNYIGFRLARPPFRWASRRSVLCTRSISSAQSVRRSWASSPDASAGAGSSASPLCSCPSARS